MSDYTSVVWLEGPGNQIVLVKDVSRFGENAKWKLPGGHSELYDDDQIATGIREIEEETGIQLRREDISIAGREDRKGHFFWLLVSSVSSLEGLKKIGDEGEEVKIFTQQEFREMLSRDEILKSHVRVLRQYQFIKTDE